MPAAVNRALASWTGRGVVAAAALLLSWLQPAVLPPPTAGPSVDRVQLMSDLRALADPRLEGRRAAAPGGLQARRYLEARYAAIGLLPAGTSGFLQPFSLGRAASSRTGANVVGRVEGIVEGARAIVVSAHYDHLGVVNGRVFAGADDNASGVAVLLAVAQHLRRAPPRHLVVVAAFDAEEQGLRGAEAFVASPPVPRERIALNVNLDMVSRSARRELFVSGTSHAPWLAPILDPVRARAAIAIRYGHDRPGPGGQDWTSQSDHAAFHRAGVPFVYFGVEDHADYHEPTDTVERIDPDFFGDAADAILDAVVTLDRAMP